MIALPPWTLGTALLLLATLTVAIGCKPRETTAEEDRDAWLMEGFIALTAMASTAGGIWTLWNSPFPEPESAWWSAVVLAAVGALVTVVSPHRHRGEGVAIMAAMGIQAAALIIRATLPGF